MKYCNIGTTRVKQNPKTIDKLHSKLTQADKIIKKVKIEKRIKEIDGLIKEREEQFKNGRIKAIKSIFHLKKEKTELENKFIGLNNINHIS